MLNEYEELYRPEILKRTTSWPRIEIGEITYNYHNFEIRMKGTVDSEAESKIIQGMEVSFDNVDFTKNISIKETKQSCVPADYDDISLNVNAPTPTFNYNVVVVDKVLGKEYHYDLKYVYEKEIIMESVKNNPPKPKKIKKTNEEDNPFDTEFEDAPIEVVEQKSLFDEAIEIIVPVDDEEDPFDTEFDEINPGLTNE